MEQISATVRVDSADGPAFLTLVAYSREVGELRVLDGFGVTSTRRSELLTSSQ
ncbi:hypothetical protein [Haloarcula halophila]|uniref:hypothetical protein n=1 Tax=Haloarcula TaxID=2237 RepID=UPI0023E3A262|nr:hypothetical protein [Halomicroarcula sp. DFY41]